jgi:hypothetical protein
MHTFQDQEASEENFLTSLPSHPFLFSNNSNNYKMMHLNSGHIDFKTW